MYMCLKNLELKIEKNYTYTRAYFYAVYLTMKMLNKICDGLFFDKISDTETEHCSIIKRAVVQKQFRKERLLCMGTTILFSSKILV